MTHLRISPGDIRIGDLIGGRRVMALEPTPNGIAVARVGMVSRDLFAHGGLVEVRRPDRVAIQALVQASASV